MKNREVRLIYCSMILIVLAFPADIHGQDDPYVAFGNEQIAALRSEMHDHMTPEEVSLDKSIIYDTVHSSALNAGATMRANGQREIVVNSALLETIDNLATMKTIALLWNHVECFGSYMIYIVDLADSNADLLERRLPAHPITKPFPYLYSHKSICPQLSPDIITNDERRAGVFRTIAIREGIKWVLLHEFAHHLHDDILRTEAKLAPEKKLDFTRRQEADADNYAFRAMINPPELPSVALPVIYLFCSQEGYISQSQNSEHPEALQRLKAMIDAAHSSPRWEIALQQGTPAQRQKTREALAELMAQRHMMEGVGLESLASFNTDELSVQNDTLEKVGSVSFASSKPDDFSPHDYRWIEEAQSGFFVSFDPGGARLCLRARADEQSLTVPKNFSKDQFVWPQHADLLFEHNRGDTDYEPGNELIREKLVLLFYDRKSQIQPIPDCESFVLLLKQPNQKERIAFFLGTDPSSSALYDGIPLAVTHRYWVANRFILSRGNCGVDTIREENLSRPERETFENALKASIESTHRNFRERVAKLKVVTYPFKDVIWGEETQKQQQFYVIDDLGRIFSEARQSLTGSIKSSKAAALVAYVEAKIPDDKDLRKNSFKMDSRLISKESGDRLIDSVEYVFQKLTTAAANIALNLTVTSIPRSRKRHASYNEGSRH